MLWMLIDWINCFYTNFIYIYIVDVKWWAIQVAASGLDRTWQGQTENNALTYLKEVQKTFQDQKDKYYKFLRIMNNFKAKR